MSPMVRLPLTIEHALLGLLRQRPMHAYEMHQTLAEAEVLGLVWRLKQSQLYALLAKLEDEGFLTSATEPQGARPPRKVLHLTPSGHRAFEQWYSAPVEHGRDFRQEFLAKLFFASRESGGAATTLIEQQRVVCRARLEKLEQQAVPLKDARQYDWLVFQFRITQLATILTWLDTCADVVATGAQQAVTQDEPK